MNKIGHALFEIRKSEEVKMTISFTYDQKNKTKKQNKKTKKQNKTKQNEMQFRHNFLLHATESDYRNASENNPTNYAKDRDKNTE